MSRLNLGWYIGIDLSLFLLLVTSLSTAMATSDVLRLAQYDGYDYCNVEERYWLEDEKIYCSEYFEPTRGFYLAGYTSALFLW